MPVLVNLVFYALGIYSDGAYALRLHIIDYIIIGICAGFLAVLGDLLESFIKRCSNIKDSGSILSAHGGILDRIDSMMMSGGFFLWYMLELHRYRKSPDYNPDSIHIFEFFK